MSQLNEYYADVEKTFNDKFKKSQNKLYFIPKKRLDLPVYRRITSSFTKSIKEIKFLGRGSFGSVSICKVDGIPEYCVTKKLEINSHIFDLKGEIEVLELASKCQFLTKMLYAGFKSSTCYMIVLECIPGGDLFYHEIKRNLNREALKVIFYQIAEALDFLHQHHRTHGDLKPQNVGLTAKGNVKLFNFGKSRNISKPCILPIGTKQFTAPEIIRGIEADGSIDWWSYGCLVIKMLQGEPAFHFRTNKPLESTILDDEPKINIVDPDAKDFVMKLLQKNPKNRLKTPWKHKFFNNVNKNVPLYIPGEEGLKLVMDDTDEEDHKEKFQMNPIGKELVLDASLLRYPTKECVKFIKKK